MGDRRQLGDASSLPFTQPIPRRSRLAVANAARCGSVFCSQFAGFALCGPLACGFGLFVGASQRFDCELTGDASLRQRPMERVAKPLREMGALVETSEGGKPPVRLRGVERLRGIDYGLPMASAQVKSAILLAGLLAAPRRRGGDRARSVAPAARRAAAGSCLRSWAWCSPGACGGPER